MQQQVQHQDVTRCATLTQKETHNKTQKERCCTECSKRKYNNNVERKNEASK
jgi:hypothetical protein